MTVQPIGIQSQYNNSKNKNKPSFGSKDSVLGFGLDTLKNQIKAVHSSGCSDCSDCIRRKNMDLESLAEKLFNELGAIHKRFLNEPAADIYIRIEESKLGSPDVVKMDVVPSAELYEKYKAKHNTSPSIVFAPMGTEEIHIGKCWDVIESDLKDSIKFLDGQAQTNTETFNRL
jgi:biotin-(acetyl-CoA carboxylase) ligase